MWYVTSPKHVCLFCLSSMSIYPSTIRSRVHLARNRGLSESLISGYSYSTFGYKFDVNMSSGFWSHRGTGELPQEPPNRWEHDIRVSDGGGTSVSIHIWVNGACKSSLIVAVDSSANEIRIAVKHRYRSRQSCYPQ